MHTPQAGITSQSRRAKSFILETSLSPASRPDGEGRSYLGLTETIANRITPWHPQEDAQIGCAKTARRIRRADYPAHDFDGSYSDRKKRQTNSYITEPDSRFVQRL